MTGLHKLMSRSQKHRSHKNLMYILMFKSRRELAVLDDMNENLNLNFSFKLLKKFPSTYLKMNLVVTDAYIDGFIKADNTFLYQLAFDPLKRKLVPLNPYPPDIKPEDVKYAGPYPFHWHFSSDDLKRTATQFYVCVIEASGAIV